MPKSIREIVKEIQSEILKVEDLTPDRASELLVQLSSIYGNILDEIRRTEAIYLNVLRLAYENEAKANRAKIIAMNDPSYGFWQEAKNTKELTLEMIRGLKYYIKGREEEWKISN